MMNGVVTHEGLEVLADAGEAFFAVSTPTASGRRSLKRAAELFAIDEWGSDCGFVEKAWRSHSEPEPAFISIAVSCWQIVVTTQRDVRQLIVRGPETTATVAPIPADAEFFGIVFSLGTFMPAVPLARLVDRAVKLPAATPSSVWFDGSRWEIPTPGNADVFVDRLVRQGLIVRDPVVAESFQADVDGVSTRTLQRRVARATGLTRGTILQIVRAEKAVEALGKGVPPPDAALLLGYADQAHLIRSLKRFIGQTPTQVNRGGHWSIASPLEPRSSRDR
jgi:AraC-like DNA-binding protein